ncbi:hypothetical protein [Sphingomicrobium aestuariivivum]|uniref:hypothetical protein n=1 Tax=Sphingomicrobium aestuariivivum TaxID=1582356 RepID=UPI0021ADF119|nr:hypothetical protein [Sphingomicrobium aestuariivivum]
MTSIIGREAIGQWHVLTKFVVGAEILFFIWWAIAMLADPFIRRVEARAPRDITALPSSPPRQRPE